MGAEKVIAVDAMGGDNAPAEIVKGACRAAEEAGVSLLLCGRRAAIEAELEQWSGKAGGFEARSRIKIIEASQVIGTEEPPVAAIKQKKDSSIAVGLRLLKEGAASAFVSCGNTGALLTGATLIVGRIKGVERPALGTLLPNEKGMTFLIDCGANVDAKPKYLLQFAQIGAVYMSNMYGIERPRVGLINIGAEREKGNALVKEAYVLLEQSGLNFTGNAEARDIPAGVCDVAVCDAFVGNIILKYSEGFAKALMGMIKTELTSGAVYKLGALLSKGAYGNLKKRFDYKEIGGAPFLGLKGLVVKGHGSSDALAVKNAILLSKTFAERDIAGKIEKELGDEGNGI